MKERKETGQESSPPSLELMLDHHRAALESTLGHPTRHPLSRPRALSLSDRAPHSERIPFCLFLPIGLTPPAPRATSISPSPSLSRPRCSAATRPGDKTPSSSSSLSKAAASSEEVELPGALAQEEVRLGVLSCERNDDGGRDFAGMDPSSLRTASSLSRGPTHGPFSIPHQILSRDPSFRLHSCGDGGAGLSGGALALPSSLVEHSRRARAAS